ncbi:hypothetical protein HDU76_002704, partial [Blyttiomyces sp. JEL0837]
GFENVDMEVISLPSSRRSSRASASSRISPAVTVSNRTDRHEEYHSHSSMGRPKPQSRKASSLYNRGQLSCSNGSMQSRNGFHNSADSTWTMPETSSTPRGSQASRNSSEKRHVEAAYVDLALSESLDDYTSKKGFISSPPASNPGSRRASMVAPPPVSVPVTPTSSLARSRRSSDVSGVSKNVYSTAENVYVSGVSNIKVEEGSNGSNTPRSSNGKTGIKKGFAQLVETVFKFGLKGRKVVNLTMSEGAGEEALDAIIMTDAGRMTTGDFVNEVTDMDNIDVSHSDAVMAGKEIEAKEEPQVSASSSAARHPTTSSSSSLSTISKPITNLPTTTRPVTPGEKSLEPRKQQTYNYNQQTAIPRPTFGSSPTINANTNPRSIQPYLSNLPIPKQGFKSPAVSSLSSALVAADQTEQGGSMMEDSQEKKNIGQQEGWLANVQQSEDDAGVTDKILGKVYDEQNQDGTSNDNAKETLDLDEPSLFSESKPPAMDMADDDDDEMDEETVKELEGEAEATKNVVGNTMGAISSKESTFSSDNRIAKVIDKQDVDSNSTSGPVPGSPPREPRSALPQPRLPVPIKGPLQWSKAGNSWIAQPPQINIAERVVSKVAFNSPIPPPTRPVKEVVQKLSSVVRFGDGKGLAGPLHADAGDGVAAGGSSESLSGVRVQRIGGFAGKADVVASKEEPAASITKIPSAFTTGSNNSMLAGALSSSRAVFSESASSKPKDQLAVSKIPSVVADVAPASASAAESGVKPIGSNLPRLGGAGTERDLAASKRLTRIVAGVAVAESPHERLKKLTLAQLGPDVASAALARSAGIGLNEPPMDGGLSNTTDKSSSVGQFRSPNRSPDGKTSSFKMPADYRNMTPQHLLKELSRAMPTNPALAANLPSQPLFWARPTSEEQSLKSVQPVDEDNPFMDMPSTTKHSIDVSNIMEETEPEPMRSNSLPFPNAVGSVPPSPWSVASPTSRLASAFVSDGEEEDEDLDRRLEMDLGRRMAERLEGGVVGGIETRVQQGNDVRMEEEGESIYLDGSEEFDDIIAAMDDTPSKVPAVSTTMFGVDRLAGPLNQESLSPNENSSTNLVNLDNMASADLDGHDMLDVNDDGRTPDFLVDVSAEPSVGSVDVAVNVHNQRIGTPPSTIDHASVDIVSGSDNSYGQVQLLMEETPPADMLREDGDVAVSVGLEGEILSLGENVVCEEEERLAVADEKGDFEMKVPLKGPDDDQSEGEIDSELLFDDLKGPAFAPSAEPDAKFDKDDSIEAVLADGVLERDDSNGDDDLNMSQNLVNEVDDVAQRDLDQSELKDEEGRIGGHVEDCELVSKSVSASAEISFEDILSANSYQEELGGLVESGTHPLNGEPVIGAAELQSAHPSLNDRGFDLFASHRLGEEGQDHFESGVGEFDSEKGDTSFSRGAESPIENLERPTSLDEIDPQEVELATGDKSSVKVTVGLDMERQDEAITRESPSFNDEMLDCSTIEHMEGDPSELEVDNSIQDIVIPGDKNIVEAVSLNQQSNAAGPISSTTPELPSFEDRLLNCSTIERLDDEPADLFESSAIDGALLEIDNSILARPVSSSTPQKNVLASLLATAKPGGYSSAVQQADNNVVGDGKRDGGRDVGAMDLANLSVGALKSPDTSSRSIIFQHSPSAFRGSLGVGSSRKLDSHFKMVGENLLDKFVESNGGGGSQKSGKEGLAEIADEVDASVDEKSVKEDLAGVAGDAGRSGAQESPVEGLAAPASETNGVNEEAAALPVVEHEIETSVVPAVTCAAYSTVESRSAVSPSANENTRPTSSVIGTGSGISNSFSGGLGGAGRGDGGGNGGGDRRKDDDEWKGHRSNDSTGYGLSSSLPKASLSQLFSEQLDEEIDRKKVLVESRLEDIDAKLAVGVTVYEGDTEGGARDRLFVYLRDEIGEVKGSVEAFKADIMRRRERIKTDEADRAENAINLLEADVNETARQINVKKEQITQTKIALSEIKEKSAEMQKLAEKEEKELSLLSNEVKHKTKNQRKGYVGHDMFSRLGRIFNLNILLIICAIWLFWLFLQDSRQSRIALTNNGPLRADILDAPGGLDLGSSPPYFQNILEAWTADRKNADSHASSSSTGSGGWGSSVFGWLDWAFDYMGNRRLFGFGRGEEGGYPM